MAENKEYYTQEMENGSIQISEDVVASVTGMAVLEVEGVCGLSSSIGTDIAEMLGMKTLSKGVRLSTTETGRTSSSWRRTYRKMSSPASSPSRACALLRSM